MLMRTILKWALLGFLIPKAVVFLLGPPRPSRSRAGKGPRTRRERPAWKKKEMVDERTDESFPASDPPGTY